MHAVYAFLDEFLLLYSLWAGCRESIMLIATINVSQFRNTFSSFMVTPAAAAHLCFFTCRSFVSEMSTVRALKGSLLKLPNLVPHMRKENVPWNSESSKKDLNSHRGPKSSHMYYLGVGRYVGFNLKVT